MKTKEQLIDELIDLAFAEDIVSLLYSFAFVGKVKRESEIMKTDRIL